MNKTNLALIIKIAREELDNTLESIYFSGYYFYFKKPQIYYRLLLYTIAQVQQLTQKKLPYNSLELRLKTEKYIHEMIDCLLPSTFMLRETKIEQLSVLSQ
jgi:hypothetical protein